MKRILIPTTVVLLLLPVFAYRQSAISSRESEGKIVKAVPLGLGNIDVKVKGRGTIVAGSREGIRIKMAGRKVERLLVHEGDVVSKGDLLAVVKDDELELKKKEAGAEIIKNEAALREISKGEEASDIKGGEEANGAGPYGA